MARGRFISSTLGRSKKFNSLPDHFTKLVYIHALITADEAGRIEADAIDIYADHFILDSDASIERVDKALADIHKAGLITLYEVGGKRYAEFAGFHEHNKIYRKKDGTPQREGSSKIPPLNSDRAVTAQSLHSNCAVSYYEVEGKDKGKDKGEGEGEGKGHKTQTPHPPLEPNTPTHVSSEERQAAQLEGNQSANDTHRVRAAIRRIHPQFAKENEDSMNAWARWSNEELRYLWEYSHPKNHKDGQTKRRSWIFKDLLNEERFAPPRILSQKKDPDAWMDEYGLREMLEEIDREKEEQRNAESQ